MKTMVVFSLITGFLISYAGLEGHNFAGFVFGFLFVLIAVGTSFFRTGTR